MAFTMPFLEIMKAIYCCKYDKLGLLQEEALFISIAGLLVVLSFVISSTSTTQMNLNTLYSGIDLDGHQPAMLTLIHYENMKDEKLKAIFNQLFSRNLQLTVMESMGVMQGLFLI